MVPILLYHMLADTLLPFRLTRIRTGTRLSSLPKRYSLRAGAMIIVLLHKEQTPGCLDLPETVDC